MESKSFDRNSYYGSSGGSPADQHSGTGNQEDGGGDEEAARVFADIIHKLNASTMEPTKKVEIMKSARDVRNDAEKLRVISNGI